MEMYYNFNFDFHPDFKKNVIDLIENQNVDNFTQDTYNKNTINEFIYNYDYIGSDGPFAARKVIRIYFPQHIGEEIKTNENQKRVFPYHVEKNLNYGRYKVAITLGDFRTSEPLIISIK